MNGRKQFAILNGNVSTNMPIKFGIPHGSVLGPTLFILFTNDLPSKVYVTEGTVYMYADDITLFCIGRTVDEVIKSLNLALQELYTWCIIKYNLTPHPKRGKALLISRISFVGPLPPVIVGKSTIKWVTQTRLLGVTLDNKLSWSAHILEVRKSFVKKLNLLKRSIFMPSDLLLTFYSKVILLSVI